MADKDKEKITPANRRGIHTWFKNAAKSLGYAGLDVVEEIVPASMELINTNKDFVVDLYDKAKEAKDNRRKGEVSSLLSGKALKAWNEVKDIKKNALSDIASGKFYNKDREHSFANDFGDMDDELVITSFDDDLGDDSFDIDIDDDGDTDVKVVVPKIEVNSNITKNNPMVKAVNQQTETIATVAMAEAKHSSILAEAQMNLSKQLTGALHDGLGTINNNLSILVDFHNKHTTGYIGASLKYYEENIRYLSEISENFKKMNNLAEKEEKKKKDNPLDDVFKYGDFNLSSYVDLVKHQVGNLSDEGFLGMIKSMVVEGEGLKVFAQNPLKDLPVKLIKNTLPKLLTNTLKSFDNSLKSFIPAMLMQMGDWRDDSDLDDQGIKGFIKKFAGSIFGVKGKSKSTIDTSKYEKGPIPFDGVTKKSIVEVIPGYLSKILSALTGKDELIFDSEKGKFLTRTQMKESYTSDMRSAALSSYSQRYDIKKNVEAFGLNYSEKAKVDKAIDDILVGLTNSGTGLTVDKNEGGIDRARFKERLIELMPDPDHYMANIIEAAILNLPKADQMKLAGSSLFESRANLNKHREKIQNEFNMGALVENNGLYGKDADYLKNNPLFKNTIKVNKSDGTHTTHGSIFMPNDQYGKNTLSYLRMIYMRMIEGVRVQVLDRDIKRTMTETEARAKVLRSAREEGDSLNQAEIIRRVQEVLKSNGTNNAFTLSEARADLERYKKDETDNRLVNRYNPINIDRRTPEQKIRDAEDNARRGKSSYGTIIDVGLDNDNIEDYSQIVQNYREHEDGELLDKQKPGFIRKLISSFYSNKTDKDGNRKTPIDERIISGIETLTEPINKFFKKLNTGMYNLVFGVKDEEEHMSLGERIKNYITSKYDSFHLYLKTKIFEPLKESLFGKDGIVTKFKESKFFENLKDKGKRLADWIFGGKDESGKRVGGLFSGVANHLIEMKDATRLYVTGTLKDKDGKIIKTKDGSVFGEIKNIFKSFKTNIKEFLFGKKDKDGKLKHTSMFSEIAEHFKEGMQSFADLIFGRKFNAKTKQFESNKLVGDIVTKVKDAAPKTIAGGIVGGGLGAILGAGGFGILGSLFLGPFSGVVIGAATALLSQSGKFKDWLFGKKDPDDNRVGGFISKRTQEFFKKHKTGIFGGATLGAIKGITGFGLLPSFILGGPLTGVIFGIGASILARSESFKNMLFGAKDATGKRAKGIVSKISGNFNSGGFSKKLGFAGAGAGLGLGAGSLLSSFGILGSLAFGPFSGAIIGAAAGIGLAANKWKDMFFGKFDKDGKKTEQGIINKFMTFMVTEVFKPLKVKMFEWKNEVMNWFEENIAEKFLDSLDPLKEEILRFKNRLVDTVTNLFYKTGIPDMFSKLTGIVGKGFKSMVGGMKNLMVKGVEAVGKFTGFILKKPFQVLNFIASKVLVPKHMREGIKQIRAQIIENIKMSDLFQNVIEPVKDKIFGAVTTVKRFILRGIKKTFKMLFKGILGLGRLGRRILIGPAYDVVNMFKAGMQGFNLIKGLVGSRTSGKDRSGILSNITGGTGNRQFSASIGDLVNTFNPFSSIRKGAKEYKGATEEEARNRILEQAKVKGENLSQAEIIRRTQVFLKNNQGVPDYLADRDSKREERRAERESRKQKRQETLDKLKGQLKTDQDLARSQGYNLLGDEAKEALSFKDYNKIVDNEYKQQYGSDYTKMNKIDKDRFNNEKATMSSVITIEGLVKSIKDTFINLYNKGFKIQDSESGIPIGDKPAVLDIPSEAEESGKILTNASSSMGKWWDTGADRINTEEETDKLQYGTQGTTEKEFKEKEKKKKLGFFDRVGNFFINKNKSKETTEEEINDVNYEVSPNIASMGKWWDTGADRINTEEKTDKLQFGTQGKTLFESREESIAEKEKEERLGIFNKIGLLLESGNEEAKEHNTLWSSIFSKKGLITGAVLTGVALLSKFLMGGGGGITQTIGNMISEFLGFKDENGNRTDSSGDTQVNNDAVEAVAKGTTRYGHRIVQPVAKGLSGMGKAYTSISTKYKEKTGKTAYATDDVARVLGTTSDDVRSTMKNNSAQTVTDIANSTGSSKSEVTKLLKEEGIDSAKYSTVDKFIDLLTRAGDALKTALDNKWPSITRSKAGKIIFTAIQKVIKSPGVILKFVGTIAKGIVKIAASSITAGALDVIFGAYGALTGHTVSETANLFHVRQEDVDDTMQDVSAVVKAILNISWFFVITLASEISVAMGGPDIVQAIANAIYAFFLRNDENKDEKMAALQESKDRFQSDYQQYTGMQEYAKGNATRNEDGTYTITDPTKVESEDSYNDRTNKGVLAKFGNKVSGAYTSVKSAIFGNKGNSEELAKAQENLARAKELGEKDPSLLEDKQYQKMIQDLEKAVDKNTASDGLTFASAAKGVGSSLLTDIGSMFTNIFAKNMNVFSGDYWNPPETDGGFLGGVRKVGFYVIRGLTFPLGAVLSLVNVVYDKVLAPIGRAAKVFGSSFASDVSDMATHFTKDKGTILSDGYWTVPEYDGPMSGLRSVAFYAGRILSLPITIPLSLSNLFNKYVMTPIIKGAKVLAGSYVEDSTSMNKMLNEDKGTIFNSKYWDSPKYDGPMAGLRNVAFYANRILSLPSGLVISVGNLAYEHVIKPIVKTYQNVQKISQDASNVENVDMKNYWKAPKNAGVFGSIAFYITRGLSAPMYYINKLLDGPMKSIKSGVKGVVDWFKNIDIPLIGGGKNVYESQLRDVDPKVKKKYLGIGGPIDLFDNYGPITSEYGAKRGSKNHNGIDFDAGDNTPVPSFTDGTIAKIIKGYSPDSGYYGNKDGGGYGNHIIVKDKNGKYHTYAHLNYLEDLKEGQNIAEGQILGKQGHTGSSTASHLHYDVQDGIYSHKYLNPREYLTGYTSNSVSDGTTTTDSAISDISTATKGILSPIIELTAKLTDEFNKMLGINSATTTPQSNITGDSSITSSSSLAGNDTTEKVWRFLKSKGLSDYAVAGIMGNLQAESGIRPNNLQDTYESSFGLSDEQYTKKVDDGSYSRFNNDSGGYGLAQWTSSGRKEKLLNLAKSRNVSISDLGMQLDHLWNELSGSYKSSVLDTLFNAGSVKDASTVFLQKYEIPAGAYTSSKINERAGYGQNWYNKYKGIGGALGIGGPVDLFDTYGPITSKYGPRGGRMHRGVDFGAPNNNPVPSFTDGTIAKIVSGYAPDSARASDGGGYGNHIVVKDKNGNFHIYAHLNYVEELKEGQNVSEGQIIGKQGHTGHSTGSHLHYGIEKDSIYSHNSVDPREYLTGYTSNSVSDGTTTSTTTGTTDTASTTATTKGILSPIIDLTAKLTDEFNTLLGINSNTASTSSDSTSSNYDGSVTTTASLSGNDTTEKVWGFLKGKGLPDNVVAGIMGNLYAESGIDPGNLENNKESRLGFTDDSYTKAVDSGTYANFTTDKAGYGLAQWTTPPTRKQQLLDIVKSRNVSISDLGSQLDHLWNELNDPYYKNNTLDPMMNTSTVEEASTIFLKNFEVPDNASSMTGLRAGFGQSWYDKYAGKEIGTSESGGKSSIASKIPTVVANMLGSPVKMALGIGGQDDPITLRDRMKLPGYKAYDNKLNIHDIIRSHESSSPTTVSGKVEESLNKIIDALQSIKDNTFNTSTKLEELKTIETENINNNVTVVDASSKVTNSPMYDIASNRRVNKMNKDYQTARLIASGV